LAVFQSGCPIGRRVKQAMAALPPFPSNEQILHAFAGFFVAETRDRANAQAAVEAFMRSLHEVFGYLSKRLEHAGKGDVCMNGLVILASLSLLFSLSAPELIQQEVARVRQPAVPATPR
jgi:hypothetical protein